jgi:hypothetical protein
MPEPHLKLREAAKLVFPNVSDPRGTKLERKLLKAERDAKVRIIHDNGRRGTGRRRWVIEREVRKHLKAQIHRTPSEQLQGMRSLVEQVIEERERSFISTWSIGLEEQIEALRKQVGVLQLEVKKLGKITRKSPPR